MKPLTAETKVGVVVLLAVVALSFMAFKVGGLRWGDPGYRLYVVFPDVGGLSVMAPVRIAGVDVGKVEQIELTKTGAGVTLRINAGLGLPEDSTAAILSSGVLGDRFVGLLRGTKKTVLKDGDLLRAASSGPGMSQLSDQASDLMQRFSQVADNIRVLTDSLRDVFGTEEGKQGMQDILTHVRSLTAGVDQFVSENRTTIGQSVTNLQEFSVLLKKEGEGLMGSMARIMQKVESGEGTLGHLIYDQTAYDKLNTALVNFNGSLGGIKEITGKVQQGDGTLGKLVYDHTLHDKLASALDALNQLLKNVEAVAQKIERGEGTLGKLVADDTAYKNFNSALEKVSNTLGRIERFQTEMGVKGEYQLEGNEKKGYVSVKLVPHPDKYYLLEIIDDPLGEVTLTDRLTTVNGVPHTYTELETRRKLKFSALLGRHFPPFGFRAGLMENTFGFGGDLYALDRQLRLSLDIWDFSSEDPLSTAPHLKFSAEYDPWHNVYFTAGFDQILNKDRNTLFAGAGLRFEDDDLKYLLGLASVSP